MTSFFTAVGNLIARVEMRAWFTIAMFGLVWKVLDMIEGDKTLLESAPFMQLVGPLAGAGGLLLIASFFFGSNKESGEKSQALKANAETLRDAGFQLGRRADDQPHPSPAPTVPVHPEYANKSDDELRQIVLQRQADTPDAVAAMDRDALLIRLAELDALPQEPR